MLVSDLTYVRERVQAGVSLTAAIDGADSPRRVRAAICAAVARRHGGDSSDVRLLPRFIAVARPEEVIAVIDAAIARAEPQDRPPVDVNKLLDIPRFLSRR